MISAGSKEAFRLPPDTDRLSGACCGSGWVLCWSGKSAHAWSPRTGFLSLPDAPSEIVDAHPAEEGMVVSCKEAGKIGFWKHGRKEWRWWAEVSGLTETAWVCLLPTLVILQERSHSVYRVFFIAEDGLGESTGFFNYTHEGQPLYDWVQPLYAWVDEKSGDLRMVGGNGLYRIGHPYAGSLEQERSFVHKPRVVTEVTVGYLPFRHGDSLFLPDPPSVLRLDLESGESVPTGLGHLTGCNVLWSAHADGDRELVGRVVDFLANLPGYVHVFRDWHLLDLLMDSGRPVAAATTAGILPADRDRDTKAHWNKGIELAYSAQMYSDTTIRELVSWMLWQDPEGALPAALGLVVGLPRGWKLLAQALDLSVGEAACRELFGQIRGRKLPQTLYPGGARALFGRYGYAMGDPVREALGDKDDFSVAVAAAACGASVGEGPSLIPMLWSQKDQVPAVELEQLLAHPEALVRRMVLEACGSLELEKLADPVADRLFDDDDDVRKEAVRVLTKLPKLPDPLRCRVEQVALEDFDDGVRQEAIQALEKLYRGPDTLDVLIQALGDIESNNRSAAVEVISRKVDDISMRQFYQLADAVSLPLMMANLSGSRHEHPSGIRDLFKSMGEVLLHRLSDGQEDVVLPIQNVWFTARMFALFAKKGLKMEVFSDLDEMDIDELVVSFQGDAEKAGLGTTMTYRDIEMLMGGTINAEGLARIAAGVAKVDPHLGSRLAVLVQYALGSEAGSEGDVEKTVEGPDGYVPLHLRLRKVSASRPSAVCRDLVRRQSRTEGISGLSALLSLASREIDEVRGELARRILAGETGRWHVAFEYLMRLLPRSDWADFVSDLMVSGEAIIHLRLWAYYDWREDRFGKLKDGSKRKLLEDAASCNTLPPARRVEFSRDLAEMGDTGPLKQILLEQKRYGDHRPPTYEFSRDMAWCGHAEYLENVRQAWMDRCDLKALHAFASSGTLDDIPELETAIEQHYAPTKWGSEVIEKIRKRCGEQ